MTLLLALLMLLGLVAEPVPPTYNGYPFTSCRTPDASTITLAPDDLLWMSCDPENFCPCKLITLPHGAETGESK